MKRIQLKIFLTSLFLAFGVLASYAQGVVVYKKDGTKVRVPYEMLDSISTYDYGDTSETVGDNKVFTVNGVTFTMVFVESGTFTMGATAEQQDPNDNEKPPHRVTLTKDFYIGETEVTQALWKAVMGFNPAVSGSQGAADYGLGDNFPAYYISYEDVQEFIYQLNSLTGAQFRMPTEAEWEYAARGGSKSKGYQYSGSNHIGDVAWYSSTSGQKTHAVKTKNPNELGLYDMSGNVWEWCSDRRRTYTSTPAVDPIDEPTSADHYSYWRVCRGGSWYFSACDCRVAYRSNMDPSYRSSYNGFRLALSSSK